MKENLAYNRSFKFAIRIVNLYKYLCQDKKEFVLSKQVLRSGTSIGANINEAIQAQSKKDFLSKMNIALKEASETQYWLKLLKETDYITEKLFESIFDECKQLNNLLVSIVKTTKEKLKVEDWKLNLRFSDVRKKIHQ